MLQGVKYCTLEMSGNPSKPTSMGCAPISKGFSHILFFSISLYCFKPWHHGLLTTRMSRMPTNAALYVDIVYYHDVSIFVYLIWQETSSGTEVSGRPSSGQINCLCDTDDCNLQIYRVDIDKDQKKIQAVIIVGLSFGILVFAFVLTVFLYWRMISSEK